MIDDWKLVSELNAYFISRAPESPVWLASCEKKNYETAVTKNIPSTCPIKISMASNEFSLRFSKDISGEVNVFIKSSNFPSKDNWYILKNFISKTDPFNYQYRVGSIISQCDMKKGQASGIFSAAFSDCNPSEVYMVSKEMEEYNIFFEEMKRQLNLTIYKKTKKRIPGHRYDTQNETLVFLGTFGCQCLISKRTFDLDISRRTVCNLYARGPVTEKTSSEVVLGRNISDLVMRLPSDEPNSVDCGEVIKDDITNIQDLWENVITNTIARNTNKDEYNLDNMTDLLGIFKLFNQNGPIDEVIYPTDMGKYWSLLEPIFNEALRKAILCNSPRLNNISDIQKTYLEYFSGWSYDDSLFYESMLDKLFGIKLYPYIENIWKVFNLNTVTSDFNLFLKYNKYINDTVQKINNSIDIRHVFNSIKKKTISELLSPNEYPELVKVIINLVNNATDSLGVGVSKFSIYNLGTKARPDIFYRVGITLDDIQKYFNGSIPATLIVELMEVKFRKVEILIDKDIQLNETRKYGT